MTKSRCEAGSGHEWKAKLHDRVSGGNGCPYCAGKKASATNSLAAVAPGVAEQWHQEKNGEATPLPGAAASILALRVSRIARKARAIARCLDHNFCESVFGHL